ncbi:MAG TPA: TolC family protein [Fredinandcohnia sp.]|nr:TolC family protein [Fredinandcohnia sp.]
MTTAIFVLALVAGPAEEISAPPLRFEALLEGALANNPHVLAFTDDARAVLDRAEARSAFPDPVVGLAVHDLPVPSFSFREDMMTMSQVAVSQTLPWFGKRGLARRAEGKGAEAIAAQQAGASLALAQSLAEAYAELWRIDRSRLLLHEQRDLLDRLASLARQGLATGAGRQADALLAEAESAALSQRLVALDGEEVRVRAILGALLAAGAPLPGAPADLPPIALPELADLLERLHRHPELAAIDHRREALLLEAELAEKEVLPDPEVSVAYGVRLMHPDMVGVGVRFPIPIFGASRAERLAAAARADARALERRMQGERDALAAALRGAWARAAAERERARLVQTEIVPRLRQSVRALVAAYEAGAGSLFAVLEQERKRLERELEGLDARAAAFVAEVRVITAAGDLRLLGAASDEGDR